MVLARETGAEAAAQEARLLSERVAAGRFYLACVGQFKRGKSTLLNALVGSPVLPVGITPVTSAVTILTFGTERWARVRFRDGRVVPIAVEEVAHYVSEQENPENELGVAAVDIFVPSPLLASGLCLVDTPGLGSVFAGNTAVTRAFVPHIDAALVVIGADPPLCGDELALIQEVARETPEIVFALNKADRLTDAERAEGRAFALRILTERAGLKAPPLFAVSALEVLTQETPTREWPLLRRHLERLAQEAGAGLVRLAERRGIERLARAIVRRIDEQTGALARPLTESEARVHTLQRAVEDVDRFLRDLTPVLAIEDDRLSQTFEGARQTYVRSVLPKDRAATAARVAELTGSRGQVRRAAWEVASEEALSSVEIWRPIFQPLAEQGYCELTGRFVRLANEHLHELAQSTGLPLDTLPPDVPPESGFRVRSRLFYFEKLSATTRTPLDVLFDLLLPRPWFRKSVARAAEAHAEALLIINTSRLMNDAIERVHESRRLLAAELRSTLRSTIDAANAALANARQTIANGSAAVTTEVERLNHLRERVRLLTSNEPSEVRHEPVA
jgi:hypothetical protein